MVSGDQPLLHSAAGTDRSRDLAAARTAGPQHASQDGARALAAWPGVYGHGHWCRAKRHGLAVSPWFLVAFYFVFSCGELCFLPVGISFVTQTAPARLASMLMGAWLTANFFASLSGGYLAGMVQRIERGRGLQLTWRPGRLLPDLRRLVLSGRRRADASGSHAPATALARASERRQGRCAGVPAEPTPQSRR